MSLAATGGPLHGLAETETAEKMFRWFDFDEQASVLTDLICHMGYRNRGIYLRIAPYASERVTLDFPSVSRHLFLDYPVNGSAFSEHCTVVTDAFRRFTAEGRLECAVMLHRQHPEACPLVLELIHAAVRFLSHSVRVDLIERLRGRFPQQSLACWTE
jgi:hypothetical protein